MNRSFEYRHTARLAEVDAAGIVFFPRYFEICQVALEELTAAAGCDVARLTRQDDPDWNWNMPIVHAEGDYKNPSRLAERLVVTVTVPRLSPRSVRFRYDIRGEDGSEKVVITIIHAFVRAEDFGPTTCPPTLHSGLIRLGLVPDEPLPYQA